MACHGGRRSGQMKMRLTVFCAKNLAKKDFFRLPDPFAKVTIDGSGQCHSTECCKNTLDPKWNQHFDLYLNHRDSITLSVWNHKKIHKKQGAGFLGCVRILSNNIQRLKDTGFQKIELQKQSTDSSETVRGHIVISLISRDRGSASPRNVELSDFSAVVPLTDDPTELPEGWEERRFSSGRILYVNHVTRSTQWERPTRPAVELGANTSSQGSIVGVSTDNSPTSNGEPDGVASSVSTNCRLNPPPTPAADPASNMTNSAGGAAPSSGPPRGSRRRSTRHQNYLNRSQLHQAVDLPDGYEQRTTVQGQVYYYHSESGVSTWHDPRIPRDMPLMCCEEVLGALPAGWEIRHTATGRVYYVDHNNRTTQFTDPRLSANIELIQRRLRDSTQGLVVGNTGAILTPPTSISNVQATPAFEAPPPPPVAIAPNW
jgi:E3 ubiquitin ligase SMURF1/2